MDDISISLVMWGVERAAEKVTPENVIEIVGMVRRLPVEFQAAFMRRWVEQFEPEKAMPKWALMHLTEWAMPTTYEEV